MLRELFLERHRLVLAKSRLVKAPLDSTAGGRPNFRTTQWGLVVTASLEGAAEARIALEELYRLLLLSGSRLHPPLWPRPP